MIRPPQAIPAIAALVLSLAACNRNTAPGNDREAQLDPAAEAAPIATASAALQNVSAATIKPETMGTADIEALGGDRCAFVMTEVALPSFLFAPGGEGAIKLNGKLVRLPRTDNGQFADSGLRVTLVPLKGEGNAGSPSMRMIVVPPGAADGIGYDGYVRCPRSPAT